ncbi:MAG TPA: small multi-drug export protein [Dehalococcoidia bacterium]|nr:small multi-drug export protein [Dehalococcoidia bacterium]
MSPDELLSLGFSKELVVLIISALPITELRGALPVAINLFHFPWHYALLLAVIGNLLPVPLILLCLNAFSKLLSKIGIFQRTLDWLFEHTKRRGKVIERYERIGLMLFVAIPLPVTGAWTGSLAAVLFGLKFKHAFLSIFSGILIAGAIVTCLCLLGWTGAIIAGIGLTSLAVFTLWRT